MTITPIRIIIIDDQPIARLGLIALLSDQDAVEIVGDTDSSDKGIALCQTYQPDVILLEIMLRNEFGLKVIQRLHDVCPDAAILVITYEASYSVVQPTLAANALGYLLKDCTLGDLLTAIRAVKKGQLALSPQIARAFMGATIHQKRTLSLTQRENEVLSFMAKGLKNQVIADRLTISPFTVKNHVSNILGKLGVETRAQAIVLALQEGVVIPSLDGDESNW